MGFIREVSLLLVLLLATDVSCDRKYQPIIGVLLQYVDIPICQKQYASSTYNLFIEQGGAGTVPIFVDQPDSYYEQLIPRLNGVLLPGGFLENFVTSPFANVSKKIFDLAMKMNDAGHHFPVWGTCQGLEEMTTLPLHPQKDVLTNCTGTEGVLLPLNYTSAARDSKLLKRLPAQLREVLDKEKVAPNYHRLCLSMDTFRKTKQLNEFYTVLSTNRDSRGLEFVSTMEAKEYPFYALQWHPEKINFHFVTSLNNDPNVNSILIAQYFGNFLVQEAKKNSNSFRSEGEANRFLFANYQTKFDKLFGSSQDIYCLDSSQVPKFDGNHGTREQEREDNSSYRNASLLYKLNKHLINKQNYK